MLSRCAHFLKKNKLFFGSLLFLFFYSVGITFAVPPTTEYQLGETLNPNCAPGGTNCSVQILPDQTGNSGKFLTTDGTSTSWASVGGGGGGAINQVGTSYIGFNSGPGGTGTSEGSGGSSLGNFFAGNNAGRSNSDGTGLIAIGDSALYSFYSGGIHGSNSIAIGNNALSAMDGSSAGNIALGAGAVNQFSNGSNNTIIGTGAGAGMLFGGDNNIIIGQNATTADGFPTGELSIGNLIYGNGLDGTGSTVSSGNIGIGVKNPASRFEVSGGAVIGSGYVGGNDPASDGDLMVQDQIGIATDGSPQVPLGVNITDANSDGTTGSFFDFRGSNSYGKSISFRTFGTEHAFMSDQGALYIGQNANGFWWSSPDGTQTLISNHDVSFGENPVNTIDLSSADANTSAWSEVELRTNISNDSNPSTFQVSRVNTANTKSSNTVFNNYPEEALIQMSESGPINSTVHLSAGDTDTSFYMNYNGTLRTSMNPIVADTNGNIAYLFDTNKTFSNTVKLAAFRINGSDKMVIDKNGQVGIGQSSPGFLLHVGSSSVTDGTTLLRLQDVNSTCDFNANTGSPSCGSDQTLKKNITSLDDADLLTRVSALDPVSYQWKTDTDGAPTQYGFVAQAVAAQFPNLVQDGTWVDGTTRKFLNMGGLMPYVVGAIKELDVKINAIDPSAINAANAVLADGSVADNFTEKIKESLAKLSNVLIDMKLKVTEIFANKVTTQQLCLDDVCVTKTQLQNLLKLQDTTQTSGSSGTGNTGSGDTTTNDASSTPPNTGDGGATTDSGSSTPSNGSTPSTTDTSSSTPANTDGSQTEPTSASSTPQN